MTKSQQLYQLLHNRIIAGNIKPGERLPSEPELVLKFQVARKTLRAALALLEKDGLIRRTPHYGTFVCDRSPKRLLFIEANGNRDFVPFYSALFTFAGASRRCRELGMECDHIDIRLIKDIHSFNSADYAGILLESPRIVCFPDELEFLRKTGVPLINVAGFERTPEECRIPCVIPDRKNAWIAGLDHLVRRGHRRIGFALRNTWECFEDRIGLTRLEFREALKQRGLQEKDISIALCNEREEAEAVPAICSLMEKSPEARPTALFCVSDGIAAYAYKAIRSLKLRIPEDIAVLGFSGCLSGNLLKPELSTVDFDYPRAAALAVDLLLSPRYKELPMKIYSPFEVVMRESTANIHVEF